MAETAKLAMFHGAGRPFEIREHPVPTRAAIVPN